MQPQNAAPDTGEVTSSLPIRKELYKHLAARTSVKMKLNSALGSQASAQFKKDVKGMFEPLVKAANRVALFAPFCLQYSFIRHMFIEKAFVDGDTIEKVIN